MSGAALASILHVPGHPLPSHCCCPIVVIQSPSSNCPAWIATVVFIKIVAVVGGGGTIAVAVAIAVAVTVAIAIAVSTITAIAVIVKVASLMSLYQHHHHQSLWWPIGGAGPNHATEALPMACGWRPYPWIGRAEAGSIDTRTLCTWCCPVGNIMVFEQWKVLAKVPYGRRSLFLHQIKKKKDEKLCWYLFIISGTTKAQINHDNKIAVVRQHNPEFAMITLVHLQGHKIGATRSHELPEATLDPKRALADHSAILVWKTDWNQLVWLNSVGVTQQL
jgi:hypothetical protein